MLRIYHNPRCSKSREGLEILKNSGKAFDIVTYIQNGLTVNELSEIIEKLKIEPIALVRKNEAIWKSTYKNTEMTDKEVIAAMHKHPKLMERPIVLTNDKAVIGRPPTDILAFL